MGVVRVTPLRIAIPSPCSLMNIRATNTPPIATNRKIITLRSRIWSGVRGRRCRRSISTVE